MGSGWRHRRCRGGVHNRRCVVVRNRAIASLSASSPPRTAIPALHRHLRLFSSSPRRRGSRTATTPNQWIPACAGKTAIESRADRSQAPRGNACQDAPRPVFVRSRSASLILQITFSPLRRAGGNAWPFPPAPQRICSRPIASRVAVEKRAGQGAGRREWLALSKVRNAAGHVFKRNPPGRACFGALLRYSSLIWNNQIT
jgi:hypothetical protein